MNRLAFAGALLAVATGSLAQRPPQSYLTSPDGVFRPAASEQPAAATPQSPARATSGAAQQPAAAGPAQGAGLGMEYRVGANDLLEIEVLNLENGKRTVRVNAAGFVTLPLIGPVTVIGLTQQQVEAHVGSLYGQKYLQDPQVSVFIREFTTQRITIDGAVSKPGIYPIVGQMTLLRALALAGGFGQIANSTEVKIFRQGDKGERQVATFDIERIRAGTHEDPAIRGDDVIVVQRDATRALLKDSIFRDIIDSINPFSVLSR
ncbi:polysaccharide biosynthesis/export family protein [Ramlibacter sp.]|uniref:polysaccharide biosynthesis/export family protein n=1 Tax=Ramlibacter sp. TaxID=1917967 RepID=UPI0026313381|nr:polysaccharide biosynthesis/export family protein [Ramlibacter sp.]